MPLVGASTHAMARAVLATARDGFVGVADLARRALAPALVRCTDLIVPPVCVACRQPLAAHDTLCAACWHGIDFIRPPLCDRLGIPLPYETGARTLSARALAEPPDYNRARAVARYRGRTRELVHALKYSDQHHVVRLLARLMAEAGADLLADADLLVPVPLSRTRLWQRRFNQAALLAAALSREARIRFDPLLLERSRHTASQVGLTREQRKDNVSGAFRVDTARRGDLKGRNVVLIDDVITTGATVEAAARVLKRAGAARVDVLAVAMVTQDGAEPLHWDA